MLLMAEYGWLSWTLEPSCRSPAPDYVSLGLVGTVRVKLALWSFWLGGCLS